MELTKHELCCTLKCLGEYAPQREGEQRHVDSTGVAEILESISNETGLPEKINERFTPHKGLATLSQKREDMLDC